MTSRRWARVGGLRAAAFATAAVATVTLTQVQASGTFAGSTANGSDRITSKASFCAAAPTTLYAAGDTWVDQSNPSSNHQHNLDLHIRASPTQAKRTWIRFNLPAAPQFCTLTAARLRFYNRTPSTGRTIVVRRGVASATPWAPELINWGNQPAVIGTAATSETTLTTGTPGWQYWNVKGHVDAQYAGGATGNNGLVVLDNAEATGGGQQQVYYDRQEPTGFPTLVLTWG